MKSIKKNIDLKLVLDITRRLCKIQLNEWTFTLFLFLFSLSIFLSKLFFKYNSLVVMTKKIDEMLVSNIFSEITNEVFIEFLDKYFHLITAILRGSATVALSWFIIYTDSNVFEPNLYNPFNPSDIRISEYNFLHINYFVGLLNGLLVFFYKCIL